MKKFENAYCTLEIKEGVLYFKYKDVKLDVHGAKQVVRDRLDFQQGDVYPIFCDCRDFKGVDKNARDYLAKEGSSMATTVALFNTSTMHNMIINFYLKISKPEVPTKAFSNEEQAIEFLHAHMEEITELAY